MTVFQSGVLQGEFLRVRRIPGLRVLIFGLHVLQFGVQGFLLRLKDGQALAEIGFHAAYLTVDVLFEGPDLLVFGV